jgi:hypothetical protein
MSDPGERENLRLGAWNDELRSDPNEHPGVRIGSARVSASFDQHPLEEIQKPMVLS